MDRRKRKLPYRVVDDTGDRRCVESYHRLLARAQRAAERCWQQFSAANPGTVPAFGGYSVEVSVDGKWQPVEDE